VPHVVRVTLQCVPWPPPLPGATGANAAASRSRRQLTSLLVNAPSQVGERLAELKTSALIVAQGRP
jgi:hypothetical protein